MKQLLLIILFLAGTTVAMAQTADEQGSGFDEASSGVQQRLDSALSELAELREQIAEEKIPLSRKLGDLEAELIEVRSEYQQTSRVLDNRTLDLSNLRQEIEKRREEATYLSNLLSEYNRNFETRLHIAEMQRYRDVLEEAGLAPENKNLSQQEIYAAQSKLVLESVERLHEAAGGTRFEGTAVDESGLVQHGTFVLVGPTALFRSEDGQHVGTAEQRLGSLEPTIMGFQNPEDTAAAAQVVADGQGQYPLDPTLGNAHKIEATEETFMEHVEKGGLVMVPLFGLAGLALLAGLILFLVLVVLFLRNPSWRKIRRLLAAVAKRDHPQATQIASRMRGPVGKMLRVGVEHLKQPRELIEEVMYERVLVTRLWLRVALPIIAITAAAAPLLGLLGTVTGIINTFKMITVFGSGDVKSLSGGISEALITTKFGLIVAIPALLLHAILWLLARSATNDMELAAVALVNEVAKSRPNPAGGDDDPGSGGSDDQSDDPASLKSEPDAQPDRPMVQTVDASEQPVAATSP